MRKDIEENFARKSEYWMMSQYDEGVKDYWKISHGNYIVKMVDDAGLEDEAKKIEHRATSHRLFCIIKP